jgi:hypothetical protein
MITTLAELGPRARAAVEGWLDRAVADVDADYRDAVREDLAAYFADHLDAGATATDVARVAAGAGRAEDGEGERRRFGGLPIDLTPPTAEKVAHRWWNPRDERLFVPRVFGLGWTLNAGAVAVKLRLIEPDAEDEPFASTPRPAFGAAVAVPAVLSVAVAAHYLFRWRTLPARLPSQLGVTGGLGGTTARATAAAVDISVAALPTAWAAWVVARRSDGPSSAGALAAATAAAATSAGLTLWRTAATDGRPRAWAGPALLGLFWLPAGALLLALARAGRAAEQARDLGEEDR